MIKKMQRRFIAIAMCAVVLVLALIMGSINCINYYNVNRTADEKLALLAEYGGVFPESLPMNGETDSDVFPPDTSPAPPVQENNAPDSPVRQNSEKFWNRQGFTAETPFDTRYFTVTLTESGSILFSDTRNIAAISEEAAREYAVSLFSKEKQHGFLGNYKYICTTVTDNDSQTRLMYIFLDCTRELETFYNFLFASIGISLLGLLVVFLLVFFFSRPVIRPIAESYEKQKRFITDASHEIKTPLAIIEANTEIIELENGETEWTKSIQNQIKRLSGLTEKLVFLSRLEEESAKLSMLDFSLSDAVEETAQTYEAMAAAQQKSFVYDIASGLTYHGDESSIREAVSLLLDNAMKYSTEKGAIRLTLSRNGKGYILTLWNTAEGLSIGKQDILFERFYRPDSSRSRGTGGHGIGLSVVQAIVLAHRGKISAKSEDGASILFTVTLP